MSLSADLTAASWKVFSELLDRALELPVEQRAAWLDALDAEHDTLKPALRAVLERSGAAGIAQWLDTLPHTASAASTDDGELHADGLIGPYRLLREVGVGGMGAVWLAERADGSLKRRVALKLPRASWTRGLAERMARERDILASLEHPNIARLYDAGTDTRGRPFLALEYVEGEPIDVYCRQRALAIKARLQLLLQVAHAVAFAHSRLVVHRDLKPSNILVTAEGQVRLLDFGIAKLIEGDRAAETQLTQLAGRALTLDYASPEQIRGEPLGTSSDVYSLGVVAYELLAGAKPYRLKRPTAAQLEEAIAAIDAPLASSVATDPAGRRHLKGDLDAILNKALKKSTNERYATVDALTQDIERQLRGEPVYARPDRAGYRLRKFVARNGLAIGAATAVLLAVAAGASVAFWQARVATAQAHKAEDVTSFLLDLVGSTDPDQGSKHGTTTVEMLLRARARIESRFADKPDIKVRLLSAVGHSLLGLGHTASSIPLFEEAIEIAQRSLPEDNREVLRARLRLGEALLTASRPREAEVPLATALAGMRQLDDTAGLIDALRWTSRLHSQLREPDAAIAAAEEAVNVARARLGPERLQLALNAELELLTALQVARRGGQLAPASRVYQLTEALYPDRLVRPKLTAREAYGTALVSEGDASEGVKLLRSALEDAKTLFGPGDRMVGYFAGRLMRGQVIVGDIAGAQASAQLARQTWDEVHRGKSHSDLAFGRMYEGSLLLTAQRFADAERLLAEAAELFIRIHGKASRIAPLARSGAGLARARGGDLGGAEAMFGDVPTTIDAFEDAIVRASYGVLRQLQGRTYEAEASLRPALDFLQARAGDRFELAGVKTWLASTLVDLGRYSEAKVLAMSALHVYTSVQPASSPAQAEAWETLARAELGLGDARAAREASGRAVAFWQAFLPSSAAAVRARLLDAQAAARLGDVEAAGMYRLALADAKALRLPRDRQLLDETARLVGQALAR